ncbi:MAG: NAD(P)/FAD-dependent oxidoreductase [Burkholderiaceae bacterium]
MNTNRRKFLGSAGTILAAGAVTACSTLDDVPGVARAKAMVGGMGGSKGKVVVVGGGFGGATAAKYIRMWSDGAIDVTLVEPNESFVSCPISNLVIGGVRSIEYITTSYAGLEKNHGVKRVKSTVTKIDADKRIVTLADGSTLAYDRLVMSPGIDFMYGSMGSLANADVQAQVLHAWKAGPQTVALRKQLEAMPDGGVYALSIPRAPYRCPPGPYERVCQVAAYFKREKPKSKVVVLDANEHITSKGKLFQEAWDNLYTGMIEYRPNHTVVDVDAAARELQFEISEPLKADVLNVIPPMRAGKIAVDSGLATANDRWCEVDFLTFESKAAKNIHVLGDSIQVAPKMPKSGHMANQQAKVAAAAIVAQLMDKPLNQSPVVTNTCYSFVSPDEVVHVASVHQFDHDKHTFLTVPGSGGLSAARNKLEGVTGIAWAKNIWADMLV